MRREVFLGIDVGSATVKVAGVDPSGNPVGRPVYLRHDAFPTPLDALQSALSQFLASGLWEVVGSGTTGSGRELTRSLVAATISRTEILAHAEGISHLVRTGQVEGPDGRPLSRVGTVLEIGGQDSKVILFGDDGLPSYFQMNSICSAGTGEFLKQLADEAGIPVSEFGGLALRAASPSAIDSTCTVFARRDFRHLTQKGVPLEDRLMGVCRSMVRNYLRTVVPEGAVRSPVLFQGGVAYNQGVRRAFEEQLGVPVVVPPLHDVLGALGMALLTRREAMGSPGREVLPAFRADLSGLRLQSQVRYCHGCTNGCEVTQPFVEEGSGARVLETAGGRCEGSQKAENLRETPQTGRSFRVFVCRTPLPAAQRPHLPGLTGSDGSTARGRRKAGLAARLLDRWSRPTRRDSDGLYFAGLDGGSRGTKYAVLRSHAGAVEIVAVGSLSTGGDAVGACLQALTQVRHVLPPGASLSGIGTTGSGGELFRDILTRSDRHTADYRSTEILAHYAWASHWLPEVGTVVDIGGNDAKIITVKAGGLDFAMNDKCAAGTGAFLESVANRLHVPLEEYGERALKASAPARIGGRCAVFGESDVVHKSRLGFAGPDLLLGVAQAVCRTYLSDVGRGQPLRVPIVAQGGAFLNRAVQEAFRQTLELNAEEFLVNEDPRQVVGAGALGAALLSKGMYEQGHDTSFKGFDVIHRSTYRTASLRCSHPRCGRTCEGVIALLENGRPVAGYRSIDCPLGYFGGLASSSEEAGHMARLVSQTTPSEVALENE